jgi:hypothetical protein
MAEPPVTILHRFCPCSPVVTDTGCCLSAAPTAPTPPVCWQPQRTRGRRKPRPHDGTIIPDRPNRRWGTDATMAWTRADGWVWVFCVVDHYTAEAWAPVAKIGDRFAALQPVYDAVIDRFGGLAADVARGCRCGLTGDRNTARPTSSAPSAGWGSPTMPPSWGAGDQRLRRVVDPHPQGAVPVDAAGRYRRGAPPGRHQLVDTHNTNS